MAGKVFSWLDERLHLQRFSNKFLVKGFPTHPSYLLGEIALFSFVVLVLTGIYLGILYEPSSRLVNLFGKMVPAAFASVVRIDYTSFGLIIRRIHHWSAMVMIGSILIHMFRVYFTGAYRNPREVNWLIGVGLFAITLFAAFTGYLLPYSEFSVTATSIGYYMAKAVPWIGDWVARLIFAGEFPSDGTIPRFFFFHVLLIPVIISALIGLHMLVLVKQKHTEPWANQFRPEAEGGKRLIGIPLWPQQALLSLAFFFMFLSVITLVASFFPVNPVEYYGPPRPGTPIMRPDWYFLMVYGMLKIIPGTIHFKFLGAEITSETLGGVIFPSLTFVVFILLPFLDRSPHPVHYNVRPTERPFMTSIGVAAIVFVSLLILAGYIDVLGISVSTMWLILIVPTLAVWFGGWALLRSRQKNRETK